jgi:seipin
LAYVIFGFYSSSSAPSEDLANIKSEPRDATDTFNPLSTSDLSDTPRSFPTIGRQKPLLFPGRPSQEMKEESVPIKEEEAELYSGLQPLVAEADDEDEDEAGSSWRDSGIGTGREDSGRRGLQRRKSSRGG